MLSRSRRTFQFPYLLTVVGSLMTLGACEPGDEIGDRTTTAEEQDSFSAQVAAFRRFPCDSVSSTALGRVIDVVADSVPPNEMHDCQKLILPGGGYGPLVAIYPLPAAGAADPASFDSAQPLASVFSWGTSDYPSLGIRPDLNCLWLKRDTTQAGHWTAVMAPRSANDFCRTGPMPDLPAGQRLQVDTTIDGDSTVTSRWGWGALGLGNDSAQYIGIRCGDGRWCRIGSDGFLPLDSVPEMPRLARGEALDDLQRLAIPSGGGLVPGPWARIRPVRGLEALTPDSFLTPKVVAYVDLRGDTAQVAHYDTTWNLERGENTLSLWHKVTPDSVWFLIVEAPSGERATFEAQRETGVMHAARGAVRWRWDADDESAWIGCGEACCSPKNAVKVFP